MTLTDPVFGLLTWDEGFLAWKGAVQWSPELSVEVLVGLWPGGSGDLSAVYAGWEWVRANERLVRKHLADDLLAWCNEEFAPESPVDEAEFLRAVELHQLRLECDGSLWVLYYDGHRFGGHVFWAEFSPDRVFRGTSVD
ncbi:MAG: DUF2262 domain-containing protein [Gemmataceae bacterium]